MLMTKANNSNLIKGIEIGNDNSPLSHLFYADDLMFIIGWSLEDKRYIIRILRWFYFTSGLRLNLLKSELFGVDLGEKII